eukprot:CAMPEP_0174876024 /NCGR_PEP_ID=MMETSP1114-20130205/79357_1 /TAXON_ID=312471 /ORGANISM="Neobodo designis, Strain CCAP 1951/1" /LENGTH=42 /DNA_ID= /DNA_START= /DNA_END= /DNA_ORIENTATION=
MSATTRTLSFGIALIRFACAFVRSSRASSEASSSTYISTIGS